MCRPPPIVTNKNTNRQKTSAQFLTLRSDRKSTRLSSSRCGKECTARVHVQAASDRYEQKHKQTENQRAVLDLAIRSEEQTSEFQSLRQGMHRPRSCAGRLRSLRTKTQTDRKPARSS